eukprot:scpid76465/ scgid17912/ 
MYGRLAAGSTGIFAEADDDNEAADTLRDAEVASLLAVEAETNTPHVGFVATGDLLAEYTFFVFTAVPVCSSLLVLEAKLAELDLVLGIGSVSEDELDCSVGRGYTSLRPLNTRAGFVRLK